MMERKELQDIALKMISAWDRVLRRGRRPLSGSHADRNIRDLYNRIFTRCNSPELPISIEPQQADERRILEDPGYLIEECVRMMVYINSIWEEEVAILEEEVANQIAQKQLRESKRYTDLNNSYMRLDADYQKLLSDAIRMKAATEKMKADIDQNQEERNELLAELDRWKRNVHAVSVSGSTPSSDKLVPQFRVIRDQYLESLTRMLVSLPSAADALASDGIRTRDEMRLRKAKIKSAISEVVLMDYWEKKDRFSTAERLNAYARNLGEKLRISESDMNAAEYRAELGWLLNQWHDLAQQLSIATPAIELLSPQKGSDFDHTLHEAVPGSPDRDLISFTVFPMLRTLSRVFEKALVWCGAVSDSAT